MRHATVILVTAGAAVLFAGSVRAQSVRSLVNGGNSLYRSGKYDEAEVRYRKALEQEHALPAGSFNLGDALYKQGKLDESVREFENVAATRESPSVRANALFNRGNALMQGQKYQEAVGSYIEALKLKPDDADTKYNLSYALQKLKEQQQQRQQQQKQDKNNKNDKNQQQQQQQNKDDQQKQQQQQQQQQNQENQQQAARQEKRMSKEDAARILEVLKNSERDVQKKLRAHEQVRARTDKDW